MSKWYLRDSNASTGPTAKASTDTDDFPSVPSDKNTAKDMTAAKGSAQVSVTGNYNNAGVAKKTFCRIFVGPALAAQTLTGGQANYKVGVAIKESNALMNLVHRTFVYVWRSGSGNVKTIIVPTEHIEHTTAELGCLVTATGAAGDFSILANDRIIVELWWNLNNTKTSAYDATDYYEGATDVIDATATSDAAGYFECPQTLDLAPTIYYKSATVTESSTLAVAKKQKRIQAITESSSLVTVKRDRLRLAITESSLITASKKLVYKLSQAITEISQIAVQKRDRLRSAITESSLIGLVKRQRRLISVTEQSQVTPKKRLRKTFSLAVSSAVSVAKRQRRNLSVTVSNMVSFVLQKVGGGTQIYHVQIDVLMASAVAVVKRQRRILQIISVFQIETLTTIFLKLLLSVKNRLMRLVSKGRFIKLGTKNRKIEVVDR